MTNKDENWPEKLDADIQRDLGVEAEHATHTFGRRLPPPVPA